MTRRDSLVTAAVVVVCAAILVLFTNVESRFLTWYRCGPPATQGERQSERCR